MSVFDLFVEISVGVLFLLFLIFFSKRFVKGIGMIRAIKKVKTNPTEKNAANLTEHLYRFHYGYSASDQRILRGVWHIARNSPNISYEGKVALKDAMLGSGLFLTEKETIIDRENCRQ